MASRPPQNRVSYREQQRRQAQRNQRLAIIGVAALVVVVLGGFFLYNALQPKNEIKVPSPLPGADKRDGGLAANQRGSASAKVTLVEYGDFQCPNCRTYTQGVGKDILRDYVDAGKVKFEFRPFPFLDRARGTLEGDSWRAVTGVDCAGDQNRYWDFFDTLYNNQFDAENSGAFTNDRLKDMAKALNLDTAKFNQCIDNRKYANTAGDDYQKATGAGINATPTFLINGEKITISTYDDVKTQLDKALAKAK